MTAARKDVREGETVVADLVLRELVDDVPLASIPLAAINSLKLLALYAEALPDTDAGLVNSRKDITLITATVVNATPAANLTCSYFKDTAEVSPTDPSGTWKLRLGFAPADMAIVDGCGDFENHTALFECVHTGGTFHLRLLLRVENLRRVGS